MQEHVIRVERTARYHVLGTPGREIRCCWVVLHGYGQLAASLLPQCEPLAAPNTLVVAPEGLSRFYVGSTAPADHTEAKVGASWMTREARETEIADYVAFLDRLHTHLVEACAARFDTCVLGFSQGVATAARWAALGNAPPPTRLVLWAGRAPDELWTDAARHRLENTELVLAAGDADPYISPADLERAAEHARGLGYRVRVLTFRGGHAIPRTAVATLAPPSASASSAP
jgi:predicted esterase